MLALNRPKYAPLFMRTDGRVGRVNASQVSEDMLQLQNPMKVSVERPNTGSKQRVNNYESRDPRSSRSGGADGARSFRSSRDEGSSSSSRTMNRDSRSQQPRSFDRRDRDERGPPRSSFRTGSSEPALILNNPKKVSQTLPHSNYYDILSYIGGNSSGTLLLGFMIRCKKFKQSLPVGSREVTEMQNPFYLDEKDRRCHQNLRPHPSMVQPMISVIRMVCNKLQSIVQNT